MESIKQLYYACVQPATQYYAWQVEVMLHNFLKNGISPNSIQIICSTSTDTIPDIWKRLMEGFDGVQFFFYPDTRVSRTYIPSIKPHLMWKHYERFPYLSNAAVFYHDCDMVFTKSVDWDKFLSDDYWYCSNAISYIGATYIKSKQFGIYERMCEIVGLPEHIPEENEKDSGGAQYIIKNVDATFWKKVEVDSERLYEFFQEHLRKHPQTDSYHPIQKWTAEMWATLWNAWYFNHTTKVVCELDFAWPMHHTKGWEQLSIYHNAGVTGPGEGMFHKASYIDKLPYGIQSTHFDSFKCSFQYVREIIETSRNSCLI